MKIDIDAVVAEFKEIMMEAVELLLDMICLQDDKQRPMTATSGFCGGNITWT